MPFDAMKGLYEALRRQEELSERVERTELGEEDAEAISLALCRLSRGDRVNVTFFRKGHYLTRSGAVTALNEQRRILSVQGEDIPFEDIAALETETSAP